MATRPLTTKGGQPGPAAGAKPLTLRQAADILDSRVEGIVGRWLERVRVSLYNERPDLSEEDIRNDVPRAIHGVAEALRRGQPEEIAAPWTHAAEEQAHLRLTQGVFLADLMRESQILREEIWNALRPHLGDVAGDEVFMVAANLNSAIDTTVAIAMRTYGEELQREAARLGATLASLPEGLILYNPEGEIMRINEAAWRLLGLPAGGDRQAAREEMQKLQTETAEGRPFSLINSLVEPALRGETVRAIPLKLNRPLQGPIWLAAGAAPISNREGRRLGAIVVLTDITSVRELQALRELQEQREDILRAVSHDLRNPLAAILAQAEVLARWLEEAGLTGRELQSTVAIVANGRRMNAMIGDLVDAARSESGQLRLNRRPIDLPAFVHKVKQEQAATLDTARVQVEAVAELPPVSADPDRLERIIINLLSNALKYSAPGTPVTVSFGRRNGEVVTSITDRGRGIPPRDIPRLFQRYFRTEAGRERREGLGLGLYITRILVEAHGGHIWAESKEGVGSTFSFSLPVA